MFVGELVEGYPPTVEELEDVTVLYETLPGWEEDICG
jgi:adenylosuccinate synthase